MFKWFTVMVVRVVLFIIPILLVNVHNVVKHVVIFDVVMDVVIVIVNVIVVMEKEC